MNEKLFIVKLSKIPPHNIHDTSASTHQQVHCTRKKWYPWIMAYFVLQTSSNFT